MSKDAGGRRYRPLTPVTRVRIPYGLPAPRSFLRSSLVAGPRTGFSGCSDRLHRESSASTRIPGKRLSGSAAVVARGVAVLQHGYQLLLSVVAGPHPGFWAVAPARALELGGESRELSKKAELDYQLPARAAGRGGSAGFPLPLSSPRRQGSTHGESQECLVGDDLAVGVGVVPAEFEDELRVALSNGSELKYDPRCFNSRSPAKRSSTWTLAASVSPKQGGSSESHPPRTSPSYQIHCPDPARRLAKSSICF